MTESAGIDILLPFYSGRYVRPAVESVLAQEDGNWRLTCVDDGSPDSDATEWLRTISDPRVQYRRNTSNLGVAKNFARSLELVQAPAFVMMGDDDLMLPGFVRLARQVRESHPDVDVIQPGVRVIDGAGRPSLPIADRVKAMIRPSARREPLVLTSSEMAESLARGDWAYFPSIVWKTSRVRSLGFNTSWAVALDLALLFDIALAGGMMVVVDEDVFRYRRHSQSTSQKAAVTGHRFEQEDQLLAEYAIKFRRAGWTRAARIAERRVIPRLSAAFHGMSAGRRGSA